ncbi:MAG: glycosyltransferase family 2 protein, partial [Candidatus Bathyarchaeia archaeon]
MNLSIIIPAYNEEKRIKATLEELIDKFSKSCEILVVSESNDQTNAIVTVFSETGSFVKLVTSAKRLGKGGAFKRGFRNSRGDTVILLDSDLPVLV